MTARHLPLLTALIGCASCHEPEAALAPAIATLDAAGVPAPIAAANDLARAIRLDGRAATRPADDVVGHVRLTVPVGPGAPVYGNFFGAAGPTGAPFIPNDGTTAGLVFFRNPGCVPPDFNLLVWVDVPAAWNCSLAPGFSGYQWLEGEGAAPFALELHYRPVIYFVDLAALDAAIMDGVLTIGELNALPGLRIGEACRADHYIINSFAPAPVGDGNGHEWFVASGSLRSGGEKFVFAYEETHVIAAGVHIYPRATVFVHHGAADCGS